MKVRQGEAAEAGIAVEATEVGKAAKRSSSLLSSPSQMSNSRRSSISDYVISSFVKTGDAVIDDRLTKFKDKKVSLYQVLHYRRPMNSTSGFNHHVGVLKVKLPSPSNLTKTLIGFEKGKVENPATGGAKRGGRVTVEIFDQTHLENMEIVDEVDLKCCQAILMQDLLDLLTTEHTLSYTLWTYNCWKYVYDCQDKMLRKFAELPGTSPECKEWLEKARQDLRPPELLSDVIDWQKIGDALLRFGLPAGLIAITVAMLYLLVDYRGR